MFGIDIITILLSIIFVLVCIIICTIYYAYRWARKLLLIGDVIEVSLDMIDKRYESISEILEIPLFHDSPQIRQVLYDIEGCRNDILKVANMLGNIEIIEEE